MRAAFTCHSASASERQVEKKFSPANHLTRCLWQMNQCSRPTIQVAIVPPAGGTASKVIDVLGCFGRRAVMLCISILSWSRHPRILDGRDCRKGVAHLRLAESGAGRVVGLNDGAARGVTVKRS
jgi:hypothetical protein